MDYQEWKDQIKEDKRVRNYRHIDDPIDLDSELLFNKVCTTLNKIKSHQFLPFIKKVDKKIKYRRDSNKKAIRSLKIRPLMYASHLDSHIYSYYNFKLNNIYEAYLKKCKLIKNVIAYRRIKIDESNQGKNNIVFAKEVFDYIKNTGDCVVITQDIKGFFDNLNHKLLKEKICQILGVEKLEEDLYRVFKTLTAYKYISYDDFNKKRMKQKIKRSKLPIYSILKDILKENKTTKGIPQGSTFSGLLANIYLIDFDDKLTKSFPDVFYRRYSDDLIFVCRKGQEKNLLQLIDQKIKENRLSINKNKSYISYFTWDNKDGLICENVTDGKGTRVGRKYVDYLGFEFDGKRILFRKNTLQKLRDRQLKKAERQLSNSKSVNRKKLKKSNHENRKSNTNYLKRAVSIIESSKIKKQALKIARDRNKKTNTFKI